MNSKISRTKCSETNDGNQSGSKDLRIRVAVQRKGRLSEGSLELLRSIGLNFDYYEGRLFSPCSNFPVEILFVRDDDIPEYVQDGVADLGIVGRNVVAEKEAVVEQLETLGFGKCRLDIASREGGAIKNIADLEGCRIATSYPVILSRFLESEKLTANIVEISGSVEIAPTLNVADAICDLVSTGSTLRINGLSPIATVLRSEAVLIGNLGALSSSDTGSLVSRIRRRVQSCLRARGMRYLMMNANKRDLEKLRRVLPHLSSPTIMPLAEDGSIAIHSAVPYEDVWKVIEELRQNGASDILAVPVEVMVQ